MAVRSSTKLCSCDLVRSFLLSGGHQAAVRDATTSFVTKTTTPPNTRPCDTLNCQFGLHQSLAAESCFVHKCRGSKPTERPTGLMSFTICDRPLQKTYTNHLKMTKVPGMVQFVQAEDKLEKAVHKPSAVKLSVVLLRLREQLPAFFSGHHEFSIYSPDVKFEYSGGGLPMVTVGRRHYQTVVETFRYLTCMIWSSPKLEVLKITKMSDSNSIECRWRVNGQTRGRLGRGEERVLYDAFSIFTVNSDGLICKHKLQKVMPHSTGVKTRTWWEHLLARITRPSPPVVP